MNKPAIVAPVSRHLAVANIERSVAFYRDVLGFDVRPVPEEYGVPAAAEAVRGPARIQLGIDASSQQNAILFFETDDVAALRTAISARGGTASELEKVNWIKVRMFEVLEGNRITFGQPFE
jgi:predicted enzyme related to lactoylglutathione lyase